MSGQGPLRELGQHVCVWLSSLQHLLVRRSRRSGQEDSQGAFLLPSATLAVPLTSTHGQCGQGVGNGGLSMQRSARVISDAQCSGNVNRSIWLTYRGLTASLSKQTVSWFTHR